MKVYFTCKVYLTCLIDPYNTSIHIILHLCYKLFNLHFRFKRPIQVVHEEPWIFLSCTHCWRSGSFTVSSCIFANIYFVYFYVFIDVFVEMSRPKPSILLGVITLKTNWICTGYQTVSFSRNSMLQRLGFFKEPNMTSINLLSKTYQRKKSFNILQVRSIHWIEWWNSSPNSLIFTNVSHL